MKMKRILIVGAGSYVGENVRKYLESFSREYKIEILDAKGLKPEEEQFDKFDIVYYVAGIAHQHENKKNVHLYYKINRDLTINVAEKAKAGGVGQIIIMSTMAVYGVTEGVIKKKTKPNPSTHYGKSKLEADRAIWKMRNEKFKVVILRPPMIYGKGCKGNYQKLRKLALTIPIFPEVNNRRSMLYIGNLCCFIKNIIDHEMQGMFFPQNTEYVNTSRMVKEISDVNRKHMRLIGGFNWMKRLDIKIIKKVFGSLIYEKTETIDEFSFEESIGYTEV